MIRRIAVLSVLAFIAAFGLLALCYATLPAEIAVLRNPVSGKVSSMAPKSPFLVFRIPAINLIHSLMALVMLLRSSQFQNPQRRVGYAGLFAGLLLTASFKALAEAIEIVAPSPFASWMLRLVTGAVVVLGITISFVRAQAARLPWPELRLRPFDIAALAGLCALYLWIVYASTQVAHRV